MMQRDPHDARARRRLATGFVVSLLVHAVAALLFFAVVTSSSDQSAQEANQDSTILVSRSSLAPARTQPRTAFAPPPHAPVSRFRAEHRSVAHEPVRTFHELAKIVPHGPSNSRPVPLASPLLNPAATEPALVPRPQQRIAAVPLSLPSVVPIVALKAPPTAAPTAAPTKAPPTPLPSTPAPATPLPQSSASKASPAPAASVAVVRVTASPASVRSAAPAEAKATPAALRGPAAPSAAPTGAAPNGTGTAKSAGAKAARSPEPGAAGTALPSAPKPIQVAPTATPPPLVKRKLKAASTNVHPKPRAYGDLNARLKALIPNGQVIYSQKRVSPGASGVRESEPTPPPEVLARTQYIYRSGSLNGQNGNTFFGGQFHSERFVLGYITALDGSTCTGWLIRYPRAPDRYGRAPGPFQPGAINYPGPQGENGFRPIVEPDVSFRCDPKLLTRYSGASSQTKNP